MKRKILILLFCAAFISVSVHALSRRIGRDIEFPKDYDAKKAEAILKFVKDERFKFVDGNVSYWPPDWATRLSFEGDVDALNLFFDELRNVDGIGMRLVLYKGRDDEKRRDSSWQLEFSHARPSELAVYLNLNSPELDLKKLKLPPWPAIEKSEQ